MYLAAFIIWTAAVAMFFYSTGWHYGHADGVTWARIQIYGK